MRKTIFVLVFVLLVLSMQLSAQEESHVEFEEADITLLEAPLDTCEDLGGNVCTEFEKCVGVLITNSSATEECCKGTCQILTKEEALNVYKGAYSEEEIGALLDTYAAPIEQKPPRTLIIAILAVIFLIIIFFMIFIKRKKKQFQKAGVMFLIIFLLFFINAFSAEAFRFVVMSDTHNTLGSVSQEQVAAAIRNTNPEIILHTGDFTCCQKPFKGAYNQFNFYEYQNLQGIRIFPTTGNHDITDDRQGYENFWGSKSPPTTISGKWAYTYSFDYGGYHFIAIDYAESRADFYKTGGWLDTELKNQDKPTIIFTHVPAIITKINCKPEKNSKLESFLKSRNYPNLKAVISGHQHCYRTEEIKSGLPQIVTGTLSHDLRKNDQFYGKHIFTVVDATPEGLKFCPASVEGGGLILEGGCSATAPGGPQPIKLPPCGTGPQALMYHQIKDSGTIGQWDLLTSDFEVQMKYLSDNKCKVVTADEYVDRIKRGDNSQAVLLTFDDDLDSHMQKVLPILQKYKLPAIFFIPSTSKGISIAKKLSAAGMAIGSHSVTHPIKSSNNMRDHPENADRELGNSKTTLERELGVPVKYFAWPGNFYSPQTIEIGKKYYEGLFAVAKEEGNKQLMTLTTSQYEIFRREIGGGCNVDLFGQAVSRELCCIPVKQVKLDVSACVPYAPPPTGPAAPPGAQFQNCQPGAVYGGGVLNLNPDAQGLVPIPDIGGERLCYNDDVCFSKPGDCCVLKEAAVKQLYPLHKLFKDKGCKLKINSPFRSLQKYKENWDNSEKNPNTNCPPRNSAGNIVPSGYTEENFKQCPHYNGYAMDIWVECGTSADTEGISYEDKIKIACEAGWVNYHHEAWHFEYESNKWKEARAKDPRLCQSLNDGSTVEPNVLYYPSEAGKAQTLYTNHQAIVLDEDPIIDPTPYITQAPAPQQPGEQKPQVTVPSTGIILRKIPDKFGGLNIIEVDPNYFDIKTISANTIMRDLGGISCGNSCAGNIVNLKREIPSFNIVAGVNAGLYKPGTNLPVGEYVENGKVAETSPQTPGNIWKYNFVVEAGVPKIIERSAYSFNPSISSAVTGAQRTYGTLANLARRTQVCVTSDGKVKLAETSEAATIGDVEEYLRTNENCAAVMNLDGGGSTQMTYEFGGQKFEDPGSDKGYLPRWLGRKVANFIVVVPKGGMAYGSPTICPPAIVSNLPEEEILYAAYNVLPSFAVEVNQDFSGFQNVKDLIQKNFDECAGKNDILNCLQEKTINPDFDFYFKKQGEIAPSGNEWNTYCESPEQEFVNDFVESYQDCRDSGTKDSCYCEIKGYGKLKDSKVRVTAVSQKTFMAAVDNPSYSITAESGSFTTQFPSEIAKLGMIIQDKPLTIPVLVRDYDKKELSFVEVPSLKTTRKCDTSQNTIIRVCALSKNKIYGQNPVTSKIEPTPVVYRFALQAQDLPPPPVESVEAKDLERTKGLIILGWDKLPQTDIVKYNIYSSDSNFKNSKPSEQEVAKEIDIASAPQVFTFKGVKCFWQGSRCDYKLNVVYKQGSSEYAGEIPINEGTFVYEESKGKYYYIYLTADEKTHYYGITAVDKKEQESISFLETPQTSSVDDIPAGLVTVTATPIGTTAVSLSWAVPENYIDGTAMAEDVKSGISYEIHQKCGENPKNVFEFTATSIEQGPDCDTKIVAKRGNLPSKDLEIDSEIFKALGIE